MSVWTREPKHWCKGRLKLLRAAEMAVNVQRSVCMNKPHSTCSYLHVLSLSGNDSGTQSNTTKSIPNIQIFLNFLAILDQIKHYYQLILLLEIVSFGWLDMQNRTNTAVWKHFGMTSLQAQKLYWPYYWPNVFLSCPALLHHACTIMTPDRGTELCLMSH